MALSEYWSADLSELARTMASALFEDRRDPFERLPVAVPSVGVGRWLQEAIATRLGAAAHIDFIPLRQAVDGALDALSAPEHARPARYWAPDSAVPGHHANRWRPDVLRFRLVGCLLERAQQTDFAAVSQYLRCAAGAPILEHRLLSFAGKVGGTLDALIYDRPEQSLRWAADPASAPAHHRWLAWLLADLAVDAPDGPLRPWMDGKLSAAPASWPPLRVFGLTWLSPGLRVRLQALSARLDVQLYRAEVSRGRRARLAAGVAPRAAAQASSRNPVLASLADVSIDTHAWLAETSAEPSVEVPGRATFPATLLGRLQAWIDQEGTLPLDAPWSPDDSLRFHATYGPLRQVELLRDSLLALFDQSDPQESPGYDARDVLIVTPDLTTFAPLVEAVFAQRGVAVRRSEPGQEDSEPSEDPIPAATDREPRLPALPVAITHLGLTQTNRVADVLLTLLRLSEERVTAAGLMELLSLAPVRQRLGISADQLGEVQTLIAKSGARWALDADDRAAVDQPRQHANTVRFGLERLALGVLMPDADRSIRGRPAEDVLATQPVAALEQRSAEGRALVAALIRATRVLEHLRESARGGALDAAGWRAWCAQALAALSRTSDQATWLTVQVNETLDQLVEDMEAGGLAGRPVALSAFHRLLQGRFEVAQAPRRVITGAATLGGLDTLRGVPHRVIALLGMDDRAFPRGDEPPAWDPLQVAEPGERSARAVDRHVLLDLLMAAREQLWVFWSGRDLVRGDERPAAVPVEELIDTVAQLTGCGRDVIERVAPRQPWSPAAFTSAPGVFDAGLARATEAAQRVAAGETPTWAGLGSRRDARLPPEDVPPRTLSLDRLAANLVEPQKMLLYERLGIWLPKSAASLLSREPIELDKLDDSVVLSAALEAALASTPPGDVEALTDQVVDALSGRGELPLQAGGRRIAHEQVTAALDQRLAFEQMDGDPVEPPTLKLRIAEMLLSGRPERARRRGDELVLEWLSPRSSGNTKSLLTPWLYLLAARALGLPVRLARTVNKGETPKSGAKVPPGIFFFSEASPQEAEARLEGLVTVWRAARHEPLPLFRNTSPALGEILARSAPDPADPRKLRLKAKKKWECTRDYPYGDDGDRWVQAFFSDFHPDQVMKTDEQVHPLPTEGLLGLADRVWRPLYAAMDEATKHIGTWLPKTGGPS